MLCTSSSSSLFAFCTIVLLVGCESQQANSHEDGGPDRGFQIPQPPAPKPPPSFYALSVDKAVDVLFVIDDTEEMDSAQESLRRNIASLIEGLRLPNTGGKLPYLHIGVISSNLEAKFGQLQSAPGVAGCVPPREPWIALLEGKTNIPECPGDGAQCVKDAFSCIAALGSRSKRFPKPFEATRRALATKLNPGFLRKKALLAVVFLSATDDCSARNPQLFDPQQQGLNDPLGPLTSFRCFEFGVQCDVNDRLVTGERKNCVPAYDWLYKTQDYIQAFKNLKTRPDQVLMAAITGPTSPVIVGRDGPNPALEPSCQGPNGQATPAIRIMDVVNAFHGQFAPICDAQAYGPLLKSLGEKIVATLGGQCIRQPLGLPNDGIACHSGVGPCKIPTCVAGASCNATTGMCERDGQSTGNYCGVTCLDKVEALVYEETLDGRESNEIKKCPREFFQDPTMAADQCGEHCPCWRIVPRPETCKPELGVSPFGLEIVRKDDPPRGTVAKMLVRTKDFPWSAPEVQSATSHCTHP